MPINPFGAQQRFWAYPPVIKRCDVGRGSNHRCPAGTPLTNKKLEKKAVKRTRQKEKLPF